MLYILAANLQVELFYDAYGMSAAVFYAHLPFKYSQNAEGNQVIIKTWHTHFHFYLHLMEYKPGHADNNTGYNFIYNPR